LKRASINDIKQKFVSMSEIDIIVSEKSDANVAIESESSDDEEYITSVLIADDDIVQLRGL
jgi:hypothetical protein